MANPRFKNTVCDRINTLILLEMLGELPDNERKELGAWIEFSPENALLYDDLTALKELRTMGECDLDAI